MNSGTGTYYKPLQHSHQVRCERRARTAEGGKEQVGGGGQTEGERKEGEGRRRDKGVGEPCREERLTPVCLFCLMRENKHEEGDVCVR